MGVFSKNRYPNNKPSRNTFDLSHRNHLTLDFGSLIPVLCQEVIPGDTFEINTDFLLRFMPLAFPVQTQIRADIHYFYVRNRNLWNDWMNFIGMTGDTSKIAMPYLNTTSNKISTGSLADYLGCPTTLTGDNKEVIVEGSSTVLHSYGSPTSLYVQPENFNTDDAWLSTSFVTGNTYRLNRRATVGATSPGKDAWCMFKGDFPTGKQSVVKGDKLQFTINTESGNSTVLDKLVAYVYLTNYGTVKASVSVTAAGNSDDVTFSILIDRNADYVYGYEVYFYCDDVEPTTTSNIATNTGTNLSPSFQDFTLKGVWRSLSSIREWSSTNPYPVSLNALPFRAYESIYNAFYRDNRNNPYLVNGVNDPNVYLPTKEGGLDSNVYTIHRRNWEQDFLTSAVPSPQQGVAPLVGLTSTGVASYASEDGTVYKVKMTTAEDGDTITGAEYSSSLPGDVARSVVQVASDGISINDFRGVNALQCWLERNMRNGLKYKDQIASHFGVEPSYAELDMPEFIGGVSQIVDIQQVNQTAPSEGDPLGSYAGQAYAFGSSKHKVRHYCDEHGYIIGILSVVPVPSYSQLLPKHFTKSQPLDYFTPEFGHIGMQPIPYREVTPLQAKYHGKNLDSTFGYQRAWYDYLANFDSVHGDFRNTLRDFILQRQFDEVPSLNPDFLLVSASQLNDIFTVNEIVDSEGHKISVQPILGAVQFDIKAKRPIPRFGIPRLE